MSTTPGRATKLKSYIHQDKATVLVTDKIFRQIQIMHNLAKGNEWSGILFYRIISGEIDDPANLVLRLEEVLPMDIGNPTYTEYDFDLLDPVVSDAIERTLEDPSLKYGHMHSHQDMNCFFSGTDVDECEDNADKYDHYVSIIINKKNDMEKNWCGRICINGEEEVSGNVSVTTKYNSGLGRVETTPISKKERIIKNIDCVIKPDPNSFWEDIDRANEILTKKETVVRTIPYTQNNQYSSQDSKKTTSTSTYNDSGFIVESKRASMTKRMVRDFIFHSINYSTDIDLGYDKKFGIIEPNVKAAFEFLNNLSEGEALELLKDDPIATFRTDVQTYYRNFKHILVWNDYYLFAKMIILVMKQYKVSDSLLVKVIDAFGHNLQAPSITPYTKAQIKAYTGVNNKELNFLMQDFSKYADLEKAYAVNEDDADNKAFWDNIEKSNSIDVNELSEDELRILGSYV